MSLAKVIVVVGLGVFLTTPSASSDDTDFETCEQRVRQTPGDREANRCFYAVAQRTGRWSEAERHLRARLAATPDNPWLHFFLGHVEWRDRQPEVVDHYRVAAGLLIDREDHGGATEAYLNIAHFLRSTGDVTEAWEALNEALTTSRSIDDIGLQHRVRLERARHRIAVGDDLGDIYRRLRELEAEMSADSRYDLRRDSLLSLGQIAYELGQFRQALAYRRRSLDLARSQQDLPGEATARFEIAAVSSVLELPGPQRRDVVVARTSEALDAARTAGHRRLEARAHGMLGDLLTESAGRRHAEACLEIAESLALDDVVIDCSAALARHVVRDDPERARRLVDQALARSLDAENPWDLIYHWSSLGRAVPRTHSRSETLSLMARVLDTLEALSAAQVFDSERLRLISVWSEFYYLTAGILLDTGEREPVRRDVETAFARIERLRTLTWRQTTRGPHPPIDPEIAAALREVLAQRVDVYRQLLDPRRTEVEQRRALDRLDEIENDERQWRYEIATRDPSARDPVRLTPVALSELEASLRPDEALLSFQLGFWEDIFGAFGGGSWLLVVTRDGTRRYRLPDSVDLEPTLRLLLGLADPEVAERALVRLHHDMLRPALGDLPPGVERLLLVPDGILHLLPFAALRDRLAGSPVASRYALTVVPSASHVAHWRSRPPSPAAGRPVLVLADPALAPGDMGPRHEPDAAERSWTLGAPPHFGRLPHARREGRSVIRRAPGSGILRIGADATEQSLATADLGQFSIVHFAAHALVDTEHPRRSAIVLAAGSDQEDGLLHPDEIRQLSFDGQVIVLSACSTAVGDVLHGVGAMSLARAFFQAGARTVVASLWPLPDDRAAAAFDRAYQRMAAGDDVATAIHAVQREQVDAGRPARDWAGLVVFGDGDLVPFPPRATSSSSVPLPRWLIAVVGLAVLVLIVLGARSRFA
ncbi:MAG: CHAT domain-containing protein [Acidobacteriota bacterium]